MGPAAGRVAVRYAAAMKRAVLLATLLVGMAVCPAVAGASRLPTAEERSQLTAAAQRYLASASTPPETLEHLTLIRISSIDENWASAGSDTKGFSPFMYFHRISSAEWMVVSASDGCLTPDEAGLSSDIALELGACPPVRRTQIHFYNGHGGVGMVISKSEDLLACEQDRTPLALKLESQQNTFEIKTSSMCRRGGWQRSGRSPGVRVESRTWSKASEVGSTLFFGENVLPISREYRFYFHAADRILTGWLTVRHQLQRYVRIYEGRDQFVNYCIDRNKEVRSSHGRLYCVREVPGHSFLALHPHRWHK